MEQLYKTRVHDGIGYSKNAEDAWYRGERPRCAPDWGGRLVATCKHHVEVPDSSASGGFRRQYVMFYIGSPSGDDKTRPKNGFAVVSKNGNIMAFNAALPDAIHAFYKQLGSNGADYIVPVKIVPCGEPIHPSVEPQQEKVINEP